MRHDCRWFSIAPSARSKCDAIRELVDEVRLVSESKMLDAIRILLLGRNWTIQDSLFLKTEGWLCFRGLN